MKTKSGGGFGATVSSTRWNRYGTFATQFKAGSTGPGIVTAFMLTNPALGEEISFQITGRDPKTVLTEYYKHSTESMEGVKDGAGGGVGWKPASVPGLHWPHLPSVLSIESITTRGRKIKDLLLHKTHNDNDGTTAEKSGENIEGSTIEDLKTINAHGYGDDDDDSSLEESHTLKKSATENDLVYKIEWTPKKIEWSINGQVLRTLRPKDLLQYKKKNLEIPSQPMQIQLTIWDAGHSKDTRAWAGGETDYGENDEREYVTLVDWIEIACYDNKEAKRNPWPGKDASARLAQAKAEERKAEEEKEARKKDMAKKDKESQQASSSTKGWLSFGSSGNDSSDDSTTTTADVKPKTKKQLKQEEKQRKKAEKSKKQAAAQKEKERQAKEPGVLSRLSDRVIRILLRWNFIVLFLVATGSYLTEPANARKLHLASKERLGLQQ